MQIDTRTLMQQAERRWSQLRAAEPDLDAPIGVQRALVSRVLGALAALDHGALAASVDLRTATARLAQRIPVLREEPVPLPIDLLGPLLRAICGDLERGGAGPAARHIRDALDERRLDEGSLLGASLARNQRAIREGAARLGLAPDLLWLVAELGAGPVACGLQAALGDTAGRDARENTLERQRLQAALAAWDRGFCWLCGSWPALAERHDGRRGLRCSFCGARWHTPTAGCICCGEAGQAFVTSVPDVERPERRIEACGSCRTYLKVIDVAEPIPFPLLPIEDMASADLDVAAMDEGYTRPALPEFGIRIADCMRIAE